jgi:hypothetical protein
MLKRLFLTIVLTIFVAHLPPASLADEGWRFPTDRISFDQWQTYRDEIRSLPNARILEENNQLIIFPEQSDIIYVFTTFGHPAHPAVVKRQVVENSGGISMRRQGHYAGDEVEFRKWWREFDELDRQLRESIGK